MKFLRLFVFTTGMSITAIEMAASRFLAPYFGNSMIVWANVIGIILLGLAIGYMIGGRLADQYPDKQHFYLVGLFGGIAVSLIPFLQQFPLELVAQRLSVLEAWEIIGSFLISIFLFGAPVCILAILSPYAVRIASENISLVGRSAGSLYFFSTLGSIVGIYISTFLFIPFVGVKETIWICAFLVVILSIIGLQHKKKFLFLILFPLLATLVSPPLQAESFGETLYTTESLYQHIEVQKSEDDTRFLVFNEGGAMQSVYHPSMRLTGQYYDYYTPLLYLDQFKDKETIKVLNIGYAGGTIGKVMHTFRPEGKKLLIHGVEIDPTVTQISKEYFGVTDDERTIFTQDGRTFLRSTDEQYDIIIIDAYSKALYIPPHLITKEFFHEVKTHLTPEGMVAFHINSLSQDSPLFRTTANTLRQAMENVYVFPIKNRTNQLVMGTRDITPTLSQEVFVLQPELDKYFSHIRDSIFEFIPNDHDTFFTDNKSSIEFMVHQEVLNIREYYKH